MTIQAILMMIGAGTVMYGVFRFMFALCDAIERKWGLANPYKPILEFFTNVIN